MQIDSLIIRRSPAVLVYRIVWITMLFYIVTAITHPVVELLWLRAGFGNSFGNRFLWSLTTITIESFIICLLFIHWSMTTYEIRPGELIYRSGFIRRRMDIHSLKNMQTVYVSQGILGRIFKYGTLSLFNPMSKEELLLKNISDPDRHVESMRQVLDIPAGETILRSVK